ncbi:MAG: ABC transporter permease [Chloroflexota bacterium]|nr:ABC transporter permease [Chloroflexota bacterium]
MGQILGYTVMLLRAYARDRTALFFGFFFPLLFMVLFGVLNFGGSVRVDLGVVDEAKNDQSASFIATLGKIETFKLTTGERDAELAKLSAGDRDLVLVIPSDFRVAPARPGASVPTLALYRSSAQAEAGAVGTAILNSVIDQLSFAVTQTAPVVSLKSEEVTGRNLKYVDFLTPGIVGMTIMQLGISSVAFAFVADRQRGVIRRIMATPIPRRSYMAAHVLQRLILAVVQVLILLAVAVLAFKVTVVGGLPSLLAVAVLGAVVFLSLGFAVTGLLTSENQAAVATQIVTLPQMFLSGVFFSRDAVPAFLKPVADYLPLTFLNDALRAIATTGASLGDVSGQIIGLAAWAVVSFILAYRLFRLD